MLAQPLISADWSFALWAVLVLLATFGFWADTTKVGSNISGAAAVLVAAMMLSNIGIVPKEAATYSVVWSYLVPLAIPLLLFKADLRRVIAETKGMMAAFFLGATGTVAGVLIGYFLLPLGEQAAELVGVFSASYIGGSMNLIAVTQAVGLDPSLATASIAVDNVIIVIYLALLATMPSLVIVQRWFSHSPVPAPASPVAGVAGGDVNRQQKPQPAVMDLKHIGLALGLSFTICTCGNALAAYFGVAGYSIMFITAITIVVANLFAGQLKKLRGDYEIGLFFMYLFFAAIGIGADLMSMVDKAAVISALGIIVIVCHAVVIFAGSKYFKLDLMDAVIASNACAAGPASAAALAAGKGRTDLVAPAVLLGVFGYSIANFIGVGLTGWLGH
ncbi:DUF819 family protein [Exilibacterium tricleocarpae]|uniref:DUF819 family protein n=1 Tax=Exilibacterium tricleocarpae TaxID=2591008 RepID=A0A545SPT0_9GAMM|nr:DUF819 family protein [Exilibacterium tricleocarpae]TQV66983.1 DUF819 family protein [Exilibacterium tricleocarpae]